MTESAEEKLAVRRARWEKMQRDGIWRYALKEGVIKWGFGTAVLWLIFMSIVANGDLIYSVIVPYALVGFPVGGFFFGILMWYSLHGLIRLASKYAARK